MMKRAFLFVTIVTLSMGIAMGTAVAATKQQGRHSMSGTITAIDQTTGLVSVKTNVGELKLHFPPASIKNLKENDMITAHMGFSKGSAMSGMKGMQH